MKKRTKHLQEIMVGDCIWMVASCGGIQKELVHSKNGFPCKHTCNCLLRITSIMSGGVGGIGACGKEHYLEYQGEYFVAQEETDLATLGM